MDSRLCHAQNGQQVVDGRAGAAVDKVKRPMMGAAIGHIFENPVGIGGEAPIGEKHGLDALA